MVGRSFGILVLAVLVAYGAPAQPLPRLAEDQDYSFCVGLYRDEQYQLALGELGKFLEKYPESSNSSNARFLSAECMFSLGQNEQARRAYEGFLTEYPGSVLKSDAQFRLGELAFRNQSYDDAILNFQRVASDSEGSDLAGEASYWIGESYFKLRKSPEALEYYATSFEKYPHNPLADFSLYSAGWIHKEEGNPELARGIFKRLYEQYPTSSLAQAARVREGECLYKLARYREAIDLLSAAQGGLSAENEKAESDFLLGECFLELAEYDSAAGYYEGFLRKHDGHRLEREVRYSLGWTLLAKKSTSGAISIFSELSSGNDPIGQAAAYRLGVALKAEGNLPEAVKAFQSVLDRWPDGDQSDNALFELALLDYEAKRYSESGNRLRELISKYPHSDMIAETHRMLGETYLVEKNYEAARNAFRSAGKAEGAPSAVTAEALYQEAWSLFKIKRYRDAKDRFISFLASYPSHQRVPEAHFWLAESYYQSEDPAKAREHYKVVVKNHKKTLRYADALYGYGWSSYDLRDFGEAISAFEELIRAHPRSENIYDAYLRLGDSYYSGKEYSKAAKAYRTVIAQFGTRKGLDYAYYQLGQSNVKGNAPEKGLLEYRNLLAKYPSSEYADDSRFGIGWVAFQQKEYGKAIDEWRTMIRDYPQSSLIPAVLYTIGDAYYNMGDYKNAVSSYTSVLDRYPSSPYAADAIAGIQYCHDASGSGPMAEDVIEEFIKKNPQGPVTEAMSIRRADLFLGKKEYEQAISEYRSFISRFPESRLVPEAYFRMSESYAALGKNSDARKALEGVVRSGPSGPLAPKAILEIGLSCMKSEEWEEAGAAFDRLGTKYPASEEAIRGMAEKGFALFRSGKMEAARAQFEMVRTKYPKTILEDRSVIGLGLVERELGNEETALRKFQEISAKRTDEVGAEAQYRVGETSFRGSRFREAITPLLRVKYVYPGEDEWIARSLLMLGECYEHLDEKGKARETYLSVLNSHKEDDFGREADRKMKGIK